MHTTYKATKFTVCTRILVDKMPAISVKCTLILSLWIFWALLESSFILKITTPDKYWEYPEQAK